MVQKCKNILHAILAMVGCIYYGFPSWKLKVIGVTGTDGKTTTVNLIYHILKENQKRVSMISSVNAQIGDKTYDTGFHVTTPSPLDIQKFLKKAVDSKSEYFILETTSHALDQYRVLGVKYFLGVLTNVTHEHLDYHKTYENYLETKVKLLLRAKKAIINHDDYSYDKIIKLCKNREIITYGMKNNSDFSSKKYPFSSNLIGEFNKYNCLAAIATCITLGISPKNTTVALKTFQTVEGRMNVVYDKDFRIIVDFAHTPNALDVALKAVKETTKGRLIHVFGSAGLRDNTKRPLMGKASDTYVDISIITAEDPRTENVDDICQQIKNGFSKQTPIIITDRQKAIEHAIKVAKENDVIVITGKGHEKSMCFGKTEFPWSDKEAVIKALKVLK